MLLLYCLINRIYWNKFALHSCKTTIQRNHLCIQVIWNIKGFLVRFSRKNKYIKHSIILCSKLSLVLAFLLEHFLSKVHFVLLYARILCRELQEEVIESSSTKLKEKKKKSRNPSQFPYYFDLSLLKLFCQIFVRQ